MDENAGNRVLLYRHRLKKAGLGHNIGHFWGGVAHLMIKPERPEPDIGEDKR